MRSVNLMTHIYHYLSKGSKYKVFHWWFIMFHGWFWCAENHHLSLVFSASKCWCIILLILNDLKRFPQSNNSCKKISI